MPKRRKGQPVRVLVAENSRSQLDLLPNILRNEGFIVVGLVTNGHAAIEAATRLRPDVIAMDIHLPLLDGYEATRQIMQLCPTPIVMMSGSGDNVKERLVQSLAIGALAVVRKPTSAAHANFASDKTTLLTTLRLMADVPVVTRFAQRLPYSQPQIAPLSEGRSTRPAPQVVAVAASTGGPAAVQAVLQGLGATFPLPILLVQHIARGFVQPLADWLNNTVPLTVTVAEHGERMVPGHAYLAPDDHHVLAAQYGHLALSPSVPSDNYCPSADRLFESVAKIYGSRAIGVIMTGMGDDGARGLDQLRVAGGYTLAQDADSCVVYGMPKMAIQIGAVSHSVPLAKLAKTIVDLTGGSTPLNV